MMSIEQLYHKHHQPLRRYLTRLVGDPITAEDVCHEAFVKALLHWDDRDEAANARVALPHRHQHRLRSSLAAAPGGDDATD